MRSSHLTRMVGAVVATAAMVAGVLTPVAMAQGSSSADIGRVMTSSQGRADARAPEGGARVVVFGDSHTSGTNAPYFTDERGCLRGEQAWPVQLRNKLGLPAHEVIDVSCSGASLNSDGFHFSDEVRHAEARGAIGERTEEILVQLGKNDYWGSRVHLLDSVRNCLVDLANGCGDRAIANGTVQNPHVVTPEFYAERIEPVITYLKYYAPNARISLVSYQEYTARQGSEICVRLGGLPVRKPDAPAVVSFMNRLDEAQRGAADILNLGYVDLRSATAGHGSCSADPWVNGVLDARADLVGGPWHPSTRGDDITSGYIRDYLT